MLRTSARKKLAKTRESLTSVAVVNNLARQPRICATTAKVDNCPVDFARWFCAIWGSLENNPRGRVVIWRNAMVSFGRLTNAPIKAAEATAAPATFGKLPEEEADVRSVEEGK